MSLWETHVVEIPIRTPPSARRDRILETRLHRPFPRRFRLWNGIVWQDIHISFHHPEVEIHADRLLGSDLDLKFRLRFRNYYSRSYF